MIKQIIPADGWYAKFRHGDPGEGFYTVKLACWALWENDDGDTKVHGMIDDDGIVIIDNEDDFFDYVFLTPREEDRRKD